MATVNINLAPSPEACLADFEHWQLKGMVPIWCWVEGKTPNVKTGDVVVYDNGIRLLIGKEITREENIERCRKVGVNPDTRATKFFEVHSD